jgi:pyruvate/2-oxoglutarate dehydrogenase complex dihydrolipoamide dehydrogenase (E3) component
MDMSKIEGVFPRDEHNTELIRNTHPPDWVNPEPASRYNLVVIGGGTAGLVSAAGAATLGAKVALVERHLLGGDCLVTGCVPSKGIIRAARAVADVREAGEFGIDVPGPPSIDFARVMSRVRGVRASISHHDSAQRFRELGVDVFLGNGKFVSPSAIEVEGKRLDFRRAVIATGARAIVPPIDGLRETGFVTNETVFNLTELPRRLAVIGSGPIGSELAQTFARLGSEVTIIEMTSRFMPREDPEAGRVLAAALERDGVRVRLGTRFKAASKSTEGKLLLLEREGRDEELSADAILVGIGRTPNVEGLGLEQAGVAYDARRGVDVDDRLRTSNRRIYAAGDVCLRYKLTHIADASARIVLQNALFPGRKKLSALTVPWCTYTSPEVAHVGLSEQASADAGIAVDTYQVRMSAVDRAVLENEAEGFVKLHARKGSDKIVGATIVGEHAGEMISEITLAMVAGAGLNRLSDVIHPYPTRAEAIRKVADEYRRTRLTPSVRRWMARWFSWTR